MMRNMSELRRRDQESERKVVGWKNEEMWFDLRHSNRLISSPECPP